MSVTRSSTLSRRPHRPTRPNCRAWTLAVGLAALAVILAPGGARAHFALQAPASWATQDDLGSPQKSSPCGQADPQTPALPTGAVTEYRPGDTVTIQIDERVFHPGHYRVVLSTTGQSGLGPDPETSLPGTCMALAIQDPPVYPVLADGMLPHTTAFDGPQAFDVKLPDDVTCDSCTLQVLEFMQADVGASGNCFYHHCADLRIRGADGGAGQNGDGGATAGGGAGGASATGGGGSGAGGSMDTGDGCACALSAGGMRSAHGAATFVLGTLIALGLIRRRRGHPGAG